MRNLIVLFFAFILAGCASTPTTSPIDTPAAIGNLPDLIVTYAQNSIREGCLTSNSRVLLYANIRNQGTGDSGAFEVSINGQMIAVTDSLAAGESMTVWTEPASPNSTPVVFPTAASVEVGIVVEVDPENTVLESDESNNTFTGRMFELTPPISCTLTPTPTAIETATPSNTPTITATDTPIASADLPDLIVTRAQNSVEPRRCFSSLSREKIIVFIRNQGAGASDIFEISVNGELVSSTASLAPNSKIELQAEFVSGAAQIEVEIDPDNTIAESDESNNTFTGQLLTLTPPAPCTPTP